MTDLRVKTYLLVILGILMALQEWQIINIRRKIDALNTDITRALATTGKEPTP